MCVQYIRYRNAARRGLGHCPNQEHTYIHTNLYNAIAKNRENESEALAQIFYLLDTVILKVLLVNLLAALKFANVFFYKIRNVWKRKKTFKKVKKT